MEVDASRQSRRCVAIAIMRRDRASFLSCVLFLCKAAWCKPRLFVTLIPSLAGGGSGMAMAVDRLWWSGTDEEFFELLTKVVFMTGFSRSVVEKRWEAFRGAFQGFRIEDVAAFDEVIVEKMLEHDSGIIRNVRKVRATIANARTCLELRSEYGSLQLFCESLADLGEHAASAVLRKAFALVGESAAKTLWARLSQDQSTK